MDMEFWMPMIPPTVTAQEHRIGKTRSGRMITYDPPELKAARQKLTAHLARHRPEAPSPPGTPIALRVIWCFPAANYDRVGTYRISRPDTDNLNKMLKDCMTHVGFWHDDAQVAREEVIKVWSDRPGIYIEVSELENEL